MRSTLTFACVGALFGALALGCGAEVSSIPRPATATTQAPSAAQIAHVLVTPQESLGRATEVIALFDIHTDADSQDKGFDELRRRAAEVGADAVVGAEFEHGEHGEKSHLSGVAVKYVEPLPAYDVLGTIDVSSDEDAEDKGLEELKHRAAAMGANWVVDIHFEHGEDGQKGHLTGKAVRLRPHG